MSDLILHNTLLHNSSHHLRFRHDVPFLHILSVYQWSIDSAMNVIVVPLVPMRAWNANWHTSVLNGNRSFGQIIKHESGLGREFGRRSQKSFRFSRSITAISFPIKIIARLRRAGRYRDLRFWCSSVKIQFSITHVSTFSFRVPKNSTTLSGTS